VSRSIIPHRLVRNRYFALKARQRREAQVIAVAILSQIPRNGIIVNWEAVE
jgi:hypothetical protein